MQRVPNTSQIRVALVEDDVNFQNALIDAIGAAPDMTLQSVAGTRALGLQALDQIQADVLLVDLGLPMTLADLDVALADTFDEVFGEIRPSAAA